VYQKGEKASFPIAVADNLIEKGFAQDNLSVEERDASNLKKVSQEAEKVKNLHVAPSTKEVKGPPNTKHIPGPKNTKGKSSKKKK
jgi:hypothetical protein